jgi:Mechanosensitive ion channel, conserved TM helix
VDLSAVQPFPQIDTQYLLLMGYRVVVLLVIVGIGWALGRVVGWLVGRLVVSAGGDSLFRHTAIGRALMKSGYTAGTFSKVLAKWVIYLTAFLIGIDGLGLPLVSRSVGAFLNFLPALVTSIAILGVGLVLSDWIGEFVKRAASPEQRDVFYVEILADFVKLVLYFVTFTIALANLNVDLTILYIVAQPLAWALAIFVGVAAGIIVGWTLKDRVKDLLSP